MKQQGLILLMANTQQSHHVALLIAPIIFRASSYTNGEP